MEATHRPYRRTSIVTEIELLQGRFQRFQGADTPERLCEAQARLDHTRTSITDVFPSVLPVDAKSAHLFFRWRDQRGLGKTGRRDLLIAAITVCHGAILVTGNVRHFEKVPGLRVIDWRASRGTLE